MHYFYTVLQSISIEQFFASGLPLIDVRSPGEFAKGHIPVAVNVPLFSDDERAHIGTEYVQQSQENAMAIGYQYANPKREWYLEQARKLAPDGRIAVHCWRGGMRSRLFAEHLVAHGFNHVALITGGYKAYRNFVLSELSQTRDLRIIGGYTGSGKTKVIYWLQQNGHQAIDLEGLASHKGSAFGALGQAAQPTSEQFENNLCERWLALDATKPIWLEDESINIGSVYLPQLMFANMRRAPVYFLEIAREVRAAYLVTDYANLPVEGLVESFRKITKRLGHENAAKAIECLYQGDLQQAAFIALSYYDKTYKQGLDFHHSDNIQIIPCATTDAASNAQAILNCYERTS